MPHLDLGPNDYRKQDPKTGRWHLPDDPKLCRNMFFVVVVVLGFIWWHRFDVQVDNLFGVTVGFAFCTGGLMAIWLKDRY